MRRRNLLIVGGVLIAALACFALWNYFSPKNQLTSTVLSSTECAAPCWWGITPGKTTAIQVMALLPKYEWINQYTISNRNVRDELKQTTFQFLRPAGDVIAYIYFKDEVVSVLTVFTGNSLDVSQAFQKLGEPQQYLAYTNQGQVIVLLLDQPNGVLVVVDFEAPANADQTEVKIKENTPVTKVTYFDPLFSDAELSALLSDNQDFQIAVEDFKSWLGIGAIPFR